MPTAGSQTSHGPSHHCLLYAVRDIDASKHDKFHDDYKYRDSNNRQRAFALLIRQYGLMTRPLNGGLLDIDPKVLLKRLLANFAAHSDTAGYSRDARADLLFSTGSAHFHPAYWARIIQSGEGYVHDEELELYGNKKCVSRSHDVEELLLETCTDDEASGSEPDSQAHVKSGAGEEVIRAQRQIGPGVFMVPYKRKRQADHPSPAAEPSVRDGAETTSTVGRNGRIGLRTRVPKLSSELPDAQPMPAEAKGPDKHVVSKTPSPTAATNLPDANCHYLTVESLDRHQTELASAIRDVADILTALVSAAIFREVLSQQAWIVTLFCESGLEPLEDHLDAFRLANDPAHELEGKQLAMAILARTLRNANGSMRYTQQLGQMTTHTTSRIVGTLTPCVDVLVVLSRALDPNRKTFDVGSWQEKFTSDIQKVVTKAIELRLNALSSRHGQYQFFWPAHGELYDPDMHRSIQSQGAKPKRQIAIALGSGLRYTPAEDSLTSRPEQKQNREGGRSEKSEASEPRFSGLVEVVTCDELISPEVLDVSEDTPLSQHWHDARA
ncbi:hypothetical protein CKM354_001031000 [Cercospora kikuchii]|uniref:Uncharacterized protein n=1 Tax=Cercospora kikuchii TaxID=84275 RepID=A0A9P3CR99_9PEZI|nr:uncharacterized protein CKM354_001031000 [Cercospora kikuchii]GIZ47211.1 hypothetical protein CKM354_001031000 [Cercospora kikuchii]